jgi:hypothetical protein
MPSPEQQPAKTIERAKEEVAHHQRDTLAGSYLSRAIKELRASGSSDALYEPRLGEAGTAPPARGAISKRLAKLRRREATRSAVLFAMLAAEAYANQYLQIHLTGAEADAVDRLPTFEKFMLGPRIARGQDLFDRSGEPAHTLKRLLAQRTALVHPKLAKSGSRAPEYTPLEVAEFIVALADAAGTLIANSDPRPHLDITMLAVNAEPDDFLNYGRTATNTLPDPSDAPAPDFVFEILTRWSQAEMEKSEKETKT